MGIGRMPQFSRSKRLSQSPKEGGWHAHVIDGDSIQLAGTEVRLLGIDAPEWTQTCQETTAKPKIFPRTGLRCEFRVAV
jgi:endonuclease YncB( thermonuclease family)